MASILGRVGRLLRHPTPGAPQVSVVLSCPFADSPLLAPALDAVLARAREAVVPVQVVVAPWGPGNPDTLVDVVEQRRATADVVLAEIAGSGNEARNRGAERAAGELLLFLDPRDRLRPDALGRLVGCAVELSSRVVRAVGSGNPFHPGGYLFAADHWREAGLRFEEEHGDFPEAGCARALIARPHRVDGDVVDRGPASAAELAAWPERLDAWLRMVPAVRQSVTGPVKAQWIRDLLVSDLPGLLDQVHRLDYQRLPELADTVGAVLAALPTNDLARVPAEARMAAWLTGQARWDDLQDLLAGASDGQFPTVVEQTRVRAVLPGLDPEVLKVPASMLEVGLQESPLRGSVRRVRWLTGDDGDVAGGPVLAVDVLLHVRHVSLDSPVVRARWVDGDRSVAAVVRRRPDPYADVVSGQRHQDAAEASVTVLVTLTGLPHGTWRLETSVSQGEVVRTGRPAHRDPGGSAGCLVPSPDGAAQPFWDDDGLGVMVTRAQAFEREPRGGLRVLRARREDDWIALDTTGGRVTGAPVLDSGDVVVTGHADGDILRFRLRCDRFGTGERPAPPGSYRLLLEDRPVRWDDSALGDLAWDTLTPDHRVGLRRTPQDTVLVQLRPPLRDDELGARHQYLLRESYDVGAPLVDRVLLEADEGRACAGNPLGVDRELARSRPEVPRVWSVEDHSLPVPSGADVVLRHSREWFELLATSRWIVTDGDLPDVVVRRPGQQVVQTLPGHPTRLLGEAAWRGAHLPSARVDRLLQQVHAQWSALVSPGPQVDEVLRDAFRWDGPLLTSGSPRGDLLLGADAAQRRGSTREALGIGPDQSVVLHAPDPGARPPRSNRMRALLDVHDLCEGLGEEWTVLHLGDRPLRRTRSEGARLVDVTGHPAPHDLVLACDAAVLDYSPLRFDAALVGRPTVFFVPDPAVARGDARGFAVPYLETAPGPVVTELRDVVERLRDLDGLERHHGAQLARFNATYQPLADGRSAARVVEQVFGPRFGLAAV